MLIGLVRHGETNWNSMKRIQGQTDIPLNETGIMQAKQLADRLKQEEQIWNYVLTSDLQRAVATGQFIANALQTRLLAPDIRLRERYYGQIEGTIEEERIARWGENWRELDLGAESIQQMRTRGLKLLTELYMNYPQANILCVTHGSFIAEILLELFPGIEDQRINNLSYNIVKRDEDGWQLVKYNCTIHLHAAQ